MFAHIGIGEWVESASQPQLLLCGFCSTKTLSTRSIDFVRPNEALPSVMILFCANCLLPNLLNLADSEQFPQSADLRQLGLAVDPQVRILFNEAVTCHTVGAYTASVLCSRKLLMNVAVSCGAEEGATFREYVDFLTDEGYAPRRSDWIDIVRQVGNEATHSIALVDRSTSLLMLKFMSGLVQVALELPHLAAGTMNSAGET
jgi:hypothetical protein